MYPPTSIIRFINNKFCFDEKLRKNLYNLDLKIVTFLFLIIMFDSQKHKYWFSKRNTVYFERFLKYERCLYDRKHLINIMAQKLSLHSLWRNGEFPPRSRIPAEIQNSRQIFLATRSYWLFREWLTDSESIQGRRRIRSESMRKRRWIKLVLTDLHRKVSGFFLDCCYRKATYDKVSSNSSLFPVFV
jgi:hypothetical protein